MNPKKCPCRIIGSVVLWLILFAHICSFQAAEPQADDDFSEGDRIPLPDKNCKTDDAVCLKDAEALEAIETLHKQIDDDQSGNIDQSESDEFFRDELQNTDGFERQSIFHGKDKQISVRDLWHAWKRSAAHQSTKCTYELRDGSRISHIGIKGEGTVRRLDLTTLCRAVDKKEFKDAGPRSRSLLLFIGKHCDCSSPLIYGPMSVKMYTNKIEDTMCFQELESWSFSRFWSQVYNWTADDVLDWLVTFVELAQYTSNFVSRAINGSDLPRIAVNNHHYISRDLGIKNPVHKHKLSLKAMDVVLFGPPKKGHNILKDVALVTSLVIALGGCWFAYIQHKYSKEHMKKMMKDLDSLQKAEESLSELNEKLHKAEQEQLDAVVEKKQLEQKYRGEIEVAKQEAERIKTEREDSNLEEMSRLQLAEEELKQVRAALDEAEKELENNYWMAPSELQHWLQYTYELEHQHFTAKQQAAQKQFGSAKEACEKIRRKRTGMLGTLRIAQGNSIDDIDQRIMQARMALEEIRHDLQERNQRWQQIESFCGFSIRSNPGLAKLEAALYGETVNGSSSASRISTTGVAPMNVEDADEDYPPNYPAAKDAQIQNMRRKLSLQGLSTLGDVKRRPANMGSTSSLPRLQSQSITTVKRDSYENLQKALPAGGKKKGSAENLLNKSMTMSTSSSSGSSGSNVAFHLGSLSPTTPDSLTDHSLGQGHDAALTDTTKMPRSKSTAGVSNLQTVHTAQNGSKIPLRDASRTLTVDKSEIRQRSSSESHFQKKALPKQSLAIGAISGPHGIDEDSLSGTDSCDSLEGKRKDKKHLKLIPKFMRKTNHEK